jgi:hypothetical protein
VEGTNANETTDFRRTSVIRGIPGGGGGVIVFPQFRIQVRVITVVFTFLSVLGCILGSDVFLELPSQVHARRGAGLTASAGSGRGRRRIFNMIKTFGGRRGRRLRDERMTISFNPDSGRRGGFVRGHRLEC